ncbi:MAG: glutaminase [Blautia marasmi]
MISQDCLHDALSYGKCFTGLGRPADYIPELARVNKHQLGVCIVSLDGETLKEGAYDRPFTIQSISKLVSLILALHDRGGNIFFRTR